MSDAFFLPGDSGNEWKATEHTIGPWSAGHQHGGPPSALMVRALEQVIDVGFRFARVTVELYRPVPVDQLRTETEVQRKGRSVCYLNCFLYDSKGVLLAKASGLAIRETAMDLGRPNLPVSRELPSPASSKSYEMSFFKTEVGYHKAMEQRLAEGVVGEGPVVMWMRMRIPLVEGETPSPLQRLMCTADSGNGVSMALDISRLSFMNPDLCVYLHRYPQGEWICLDAGTWPHEAGIGLAESQLRDEEGIVGRACQSLLISSHT